MGNDDWLSSVFQQLFKLCGLQFRMCGLHLGSAGRIVGTGSRTPADETRTFSEVRTQVATCAVMADRDNSTVGGVLVLKLWV